MSARCLKTSGLGPLLFGSVQPLLSNLHDMNYTLQDSSKAAVLVEKQAVLQIHADTPNTRERGSSLSYRCEQEFLVPPLPSLPAPPTPSLFPFHSPSRINTFIL